MRGRSARFAAVGGLVGVPARGGGEAVVRAAAIVAAAVAISSSVTVLMLREAEHVGPDAIRTIAEEAREDLHGRALRDPSRRTAARELARSLAVAAVQHGVPHHRLSPAPRGDADKAADGGEPRRPTSHRFEVADRNGGHPVCLTLRARRAEGLHQVTVYDVRQADGRCPASAD
ncbi:hypothetical protein H3146_21720 [Streptomyces sp. OF3]|uniref:Uncharacterized protein n=1 Tax=Streptomyces alkaliterrae TaxID=2213162 RepID=A0A7W3ZPX2_9ACTN|nr:hypothetical protein [Streptomyces alkaliterrae]